MEFPFPNFFVHTRSKVKSITSKDHLLGILSNEIYIFDIYSEKQILTLEVSKSSQKIQFLNSSNQIQIICGGTDNFVHHFNLTSGNIRRKKLKSSFDIFQVTSNDNFMIIGDIYGELVTIEIATLEPVYRRKSHDSAITCISLTDQYVISGSKDKRIQILKSPNLKQIQMIQEKNYIISLLNHKNQVIFVGIDNGFIKSYDFHGNLLEVYKNQETHYVCSLSLFHEWLIYHQDHNSMNGGKINLLNLPQKERYSIEPFENNICALNICHYQFISRIFFTDVKGRVFQMVHIKKYDFNLVNKLRDCAFTFILNN